MPGRSVERDKCLWTWFGSSQFVEERRRTCRTCTPASTRTQGTLCEPRCLTHTHTHTHEAMQLLRGQTYGELLGEFVGCAKRKRRSSEIGPESARYRECDAAYRNALVGRRVPSETSSDCSVRSVDEFELGRTIMEKASPVEEKVVSSTAVIRAPSAAHDTTRCGTGSPGVGVCHSVTYRQGSWTTRAGSSCRGARQTAHSDKGSNIASVFPDVDTNKVIARVRGLKVEDSTFS